MQPSCGMRGAAADRQDKGVHKRASPGLKGSETLEKRRALG